MQAVVEKVKFPTDLVKIHIHDKANKLPVLSLKLPTATSSALRRLEGQELVNNKITLQRELQKGVS